MTLAIVLAIFGTGIAAVVTLPFLLPKILRPRQKVNGFGTRMSNCPYPISTISMALVTFLDEWSAVFNNNSDLRVEEAINRLNIHWKDLEYFVATDGRSKATGETTTLPAIAGVYFNITVATKGRTLGQTAFFHELVHMALTITTGNPDANHKAKGGAWSEKHEEIISVLKKAFN